MTEEWLTYRQVGDRLGTTAEAARHRSRRFGWKTRKDNEGKILVLVPPDLAVRTHVARAKPEPIAAAPDRSGEISVLHDLVNALREQVVKLEAERERDRVQVQAEQDRHAVDIAWHRAEIERLNALVARPWWRRMLGT